MRDTVVKAISEPMVLGEGPHWIEKERCLLFVDHPGKTVNKYFADTKRHQVLGFENLGEHVGPSVAIPISEVENQFVVGLGHDLGIISWNSDDSDYTVAVPKTIAKFDMQHANNSLNDAKCDSHGRLWAGTKGFESKPCQIDPNLGSLYRIDSDMKVTQCVDQVTLSNGMAWSPDDKKFYFIDSPETCVYSFDFNPQDGELENRKTLLDLKRAGLKDHYPDGMTVDIEGRLWVACYNGGKVLCVDPETGKILRTVDIPSQYTTSCTFGGPDYSSLFVTSATRGMSEEQIRQRPDSGKTFEVTGLGTRGLPPKSFKLNFDVIKHEE